MSVLEDVCDPSQTLGSLDVPSATDTIPPFLLHCPFSLSRYLDGLPSVGYGDEEFLSEITHPGDPLMTPSSVGTPSPPSSGLPPLDLPYRNVSVPAEDTPLLTPPLFLKSVSGSSVEGPLSVLAGASFTRRYRPCGSQTSRVLFSNRYRVSLHSGVLPTL